MDACMTLKDGRKLGYHEYGRNGGTPVFLFHGTPGSRLWFKEDDETALELDIHLITTDRPGYGISDEKTDRTLLDWVDDIEQLADFLKIDLFSVVGVSGGGPYTAACAFKIPHRLYFAGMVASGCPFENGKAPKDMCRENRIAFFLSRRAPWLMNAIAKVQKKLMEEKPEKFINSMKKQNKHLCEWDRQFISTDEQIQGVMMHLSEAYRVSVKESVRESRLLSRPWGFPLEEITVPVHIWHGTEDTLAPFSGMKKVSGDIPGSVFHAVKGAGHFLTDDENTWRGILEKAIHYGSVDSTQDK